jgi:hypothetical protein
MTLPDGGYGYDDLCLAMSHSNILISAHEREQSSSTDHDDVVLRRFCQEVVAGDMHLT